MSSNKIVGLIIISISSFFDLNLSELAVVIVNELKNYSSSVASNSNTITAHFTKLLILAQLVRLLFTIYSMIQQNNTIALSLLTSVLWTIRIPASAWIIWPFEFAFIYFFGNLSTKLDDPLATYNTFVSSRIASNVISTKTPDKRPPSRKRRVSRSRDKK